jgi:hypothetical protein
VPHDHRQPHDVAAGAQVVGRERVTEARRVSKTGQITYRERIGGLLTFYYREAA